MNKVLIFENEAIISMFLCDILENMGYAPLVIDDPKTVSNILSWEAFSFVILSTNKGFNISAIEIGQYITKTSYLPIIIFSGEQSQTIKKEFKGINYLGVIKKPCGSEVFLCELNKLLKKIAVS